MEKKCSICFGELNDGTKKHETICNHNFHSECMKIWLKDHRECPKCSRIFVRDYYRNEGNDFTGTGSFVEPDFLNPQGSTIFSKISNEQASLIFSNIYEKMQTE